MAAFQQKTILRSYKLRIKNKCKSIVEVTENVTAVLQECVQSFQDETEALVNSNDENFSSKYKKLDSKLEAYREKLFLFLATLDENAEEEEAYKSDATLNHQEDVKIIQGNVQVQKDVQIQKIVHVQEDVQVQQDVQIQQEVVQTQPQVVQTQPQVVHTQPQVVQTQQQVVQTQQQVVQIQEEGKCEEHIIILEELEQAKTVEKCSEKNSSVQVQKDVQIQPDVHIQQEVVQTQQDVHIKEEGKFEEHIKILEELEHAKTIEKCSEKNSSQTFCKTVDSSGTTSARTSSFCSLEDDYQATNLSQSKWSSAANNFFSGQSQEFINTQPKLLVQSQNSNIQSNLSSKSSSYQSLVSSASKFVKNPFESTQLDVDSSQPDGIRQGLVKSKENLLPPLINVPSTFNAFLSYIVSPDDFWMHIEDKKKVPSKNLKFGKNSSPVSVQPGDFCFALSNKVHVYYRAQVLAEASADRTVKVFFVDFGWIQNIPIKNLRELPEEDFEMPMRAFHCFLSNIVAKNGIWSAASIQKFKEYAGSCEVHIKSFDSGKYGVQLIIEKVAGCPINISEMLSDEGFAINLEESSENLPSPSMLTDKDSIQQTSHDSGVSISFNQNFSPFNQRLCFSSERIDYSHLPSDHLHNFTPKISNQAQIVEVDEFGNPLPAESTRENASKSGMEVKIGAANYPISNDYQVAPAHDLISCESFERMPCDNAYNSREFSASRSSGSNGSGHQLHQSLNPRPVSSENFDRMNRYNAHNNALDIATTRWLENSIEYQSSNQYCASSEHFNRMDGDSMELSRSPGTTDGNFPLHVSIKPPNQHSFENYNGNESDIQPISRCLKANDCGCPLHLVVPPPVLTTVEEGRMLVMLSNIVSPNEFYINPAMEDSISLDELLEEMTAFYESHYNSYTIPIQDLKVGMFCAGRFYEDGSWYRVKIIDACIGDDNETNVQVQYIDYGNKAKIKSYDLRPLKEEFVQHPAFALECCLACIEPLVQTAEAEYSPWDPVAVEEFRKLANFERCLTAEIVEHPALPKPREAIPVLLWDTEEAQDLCINEALVSKNVATFNKSLLSEGTDQRAEAEIMKQWNPMVEKYDDIENSYFVNEDDIGILIDGYKPNDDNRICRYFSLRGYCPRSKCKYEHVLLGERGVTRDQVEDYTYDPVSSLPEVPCEVLLRVSSVVNPERFYAILPFGNKTVQDIDFTLQRGCELDSEEQNEVAALFHELNEYYSNLPFDENTTIALSYGSIVVAWRQVDSSWHRARVIDISDIAGPATVFFVDFGDTSEVPRRKIRTILPQYLHTPFQAIECHMADIEPLGYEKGRKWSPHSINYFRDLVSNATFLAHVIRKCGKVLVVFLRGTTQSDTNYVCENLVNAGFAQYRSEEIPEKAESKYVPG